MVKHKIRTVVIILAVFLVLGFVAIHQQAKAAKVSAATTEIKFGDPGWDSIRFADAVAGTIAKAAFGCTWSEVPASTPIIQQGLRTGDIDVVMEQWTANISSYASDLAEGSFTELGVNFDDDQQGFYVPAYVIYGEPERDIEPMAPDLKTVQDLAKYPQLFSDPTDSGKGIIYGAIPGWDINVIMQKKVGYNGLDALYNYMQPGSDAALTAAFVMAMNKGRPIVGYYWEPTWLMGKYDMVLLEDKPFTNQSDFQAGKTECPPVEITIAASNDFAAANPAFCAFLSRYHTSSALISSALTYMQDTGASYQDTASWFLTQHPELLDSWLTPAQAQDVKISLGLAAPKKNFLLDFPLTPNIDLNAFDHAVKNFAANYSGFFGTITAGLTAFVGAISTVLSVIPWWLLLLCVFAAGWRWGGKLWTGILYAGLLFLIGVMGLWQAMYDTLATIIAASLISLLLGFLIGILLSKSNRLNKIARPILDSMQTMPVFVYLIPAVLLFGLGNAPAVIATTVYAVVPIIRLTNHGIRQVSSHMVEASGSFGATGLQTLMKVQIPQATPTILTGVNQTLMMAMAMVVTCSMIGATGLGMEVLTSVNRIEMGRGLLAGTAVVIIAVIMDRLTQGALKKIEREKPDSPEE